MHPTVDSNISGSSHVTPGNLLDRLSTTDRFAHYYGSFLNTEKALIGNYIRSVVGHGNVLNVGCGGNGTERTLFPASDYGIVGVDINPYDLAVLRAKQLYDGLYNANIVALPFRSDSFDIIYL